MRDSHSERVARSVWSEHQSRVTESRNFADCQGPSGRVRGDSIALNDVAMDSAARPGSTSGAEVYWGILGTCEGLPLPVDNNRNGMNPVEQRPGLQRTFLFTAVAKPEEETGYCHSSLKRACQDGATAGRLSRLIVALESKETLLGRSL